MGCLDVACPELTHLRISGLSRATSFVVEMVEAVTKVDAQQSLLCVKLPPNLRHIIVQPGTATPESGKFASRHISDEFMMKQLERLEGENELKRGIQFRLLRRDTRAKLDATSKSHWMDGLCSGATCLQVHV
jgi:hypothetical protein